MFDEEHSQGRGWMHDISLCEHYAETVTEFDDSQLELIEQQPIELRAAAYGELHDALLVELEGDDAAPRS